MVARNTRLYALYVVSQYTPLYWAYMYHLVTQTRGLGPADYGLLKAIYYLSVVVLEVPLGVVADRIGRRPVLVLAAAANSLGCALYVLAGDFATFALGEICFAFSMAFCSGAASALLYESLPPASRAERYPVLEGRARAAALVASTVGLPLTDLFLVRSGDPTAAYGATGVLSLLGVVSALAMREPPRRRDVAAREIARGARLELNRSPALLWIIGYGATVFVMFRAANALLFNPVLAAAGVPVDRYGSALAVVGLVAAFFAWRAHALLRRSRRATLVGLPLSLLAMFAALPFVHGAAAVVVLAAHGMAVGALPVIVSTLLNERISSGERRATLLSLESLLSRGLYGLAVLGVGHALEVAPLSGVLLGTAVACVAPLACARRLWQAAPEPRTRARGGSLGDRTERA